MHQQSRAKTMSQLEAVFESICDSNFLISDRLKLRALMDGLCHASTVTDKPRPDTSSLDSVVKALTQFKANLKRNTYPRDGLTSKRLMDLPYDARAILLSSIAFIFKDELDEWSQIDFSNDAHIEMLEASVSSSLAKLVNPRGRPVNEALDSFFLELRDLYENTTGKQATAGAHYNGMPHSDFEKLMYLGYQLIRPANPYASALKAWERALERAK